MKLHSAKREVNTGGLVETGKFTIKASQKAFKILSSTMYKDKISAIVRELLCNAVDSHVSAGKKDIPVNIVLPHDLNLIFSVEDNGIGLSHEDVMNLYTTYFDSTKTDTNDETGCLGLGSKSPFAYTDSFTVISTFDGVQRTYTAYIDNNGMPNISLLATVEVDKTNGVTVTMAVSAEDVRAFRESAEEIIPYFNVLPTIHGKPAEIEPIGIIATGKNWVLLSRNTITHIIQGNIKYPVYEKIFEENSHLRALVKLPCEIMIPNGTLDFAPSREELSYDPITIKNLTEILEGVYKEITESFISYIQKRDSIWSASYTQHHLPVNKFFKQKKLTNSRYTYTNITSFCSFQLTGFFKGLSIKYNGKDIPKQFFYYIKEFPEIKFNRVTNITNTRLQLESTFDPRFSTKSPTTQIRGYNILPKDPIVIINDRLNNTYSYAVRKYLKTVNQDTALIVTIPTGIDRDKFLKYLGSPKYQLTSELITKFTRTRKRDTDTHWYDRVLRYSRTISRARARFSGADIKTAAYDLNKEQIQKELVDAERIFYLPIKNYALDSDSYIRSNVFSITECIIYAKEQKWINDDTNIFCVMGSQHKQAAKDPKFVRFDKFIEEKIKAKFTKTALHKLALYKFGCASERTRSKYIEILSTLELAKFSKEQIGDTLYEIIKKYKIISTENPSFANDIRFIESTKVNLPKIQETDHDLVQQVYQRYPFLEFVNYNQYDIDTVDIFNKNIIQYIKLVNNSEENK